ncbi:MAG: serine O-acetyltransferase [Gammaproteobacteria bacterium]|jgi:serine O-acetyltransferase|nr:serine O-acetyltransferase [Gammaproteobacteria bacterium]MBP6053602.1 serine O-acetyltransferase [Pseudomonadales bacterium]MBK6581401.1 serine O-acetyltransferase [Gammaproteobacteria bacterium]MBK7167787.1 serine O-acetyltransferase [Gammaproteobacteria bacterium]MBK7518648.1 serine O-acetyltransferase [Gammaproteobacteria bacterium]
MTESGARLWAIVCEEALLRSQSEPVLASFYHASVLNHASLEEALACVLATKLEAGMVPAMVLRDVLGDALCSDPEIGEAVCADLHAYRTRDPACDSFVTPFLNYKGFHALQTYRVAHWLWQGGRMWLAHLLQSRCSVRFAVDIHPGAVLGHGIMIDHGTGIVIGETAHVGDNVSMLHGVSLGGSGCVRGDRHPKIGPGVLLSAGAKILGPVRVGEGAKVGAGSLVLGDVPAHVTVAGVPARVIGRPLKTQPALDMDQNFSEASEP